MEVHAEIRNAGLRIYRGGDRRYWDYDDQNHEVYAKYFNVQASRFSSIHNGDGVRVCYEYTTDDENELNYISSQGNGSLWDISGTISDMRIVVGKGRFKEPETRIYVKLADVRMKLLKQGKLDNLYKYHVVVS